MSGEESLWAQLKARLSAFGSAFSDWFGTVKTTVSKGQHVFRHTFATNCYYRGCDVKILSKLLGHADVSITYNTYIHLYGDALEEMRSVIG